MEKPKNALHKYKNKELGQNNILDKGCEFLAQSKWTTLEEIYMCIENET